VAVLLSLIAVAGAGYVGWRQWQQQQASAGEQGALAHLQQQSDALKAALAAVNNQRNSLDQRLTDATQVNRSLRDELLGQAERTRSVEDAVARLTEKTLSGHDTVLLDETDALLRMGQQRYILFHDAQGAAAAYALASQTLAAVNDAAFSGVRQSIDAERDALLKSQPLSQDAALQQLGTLRDELASWPLKPLDAPATASSVAGPWSRIAHALAGVISVQRDHGAPMAVADGRLTRELVALDLAQAQAALLAHDASGYAAALQRASSNLASRFDITAPAVQQARAVLAQQAAALPLVASVKLGAALTELRNLRTVHALRSDSVPAPATSSAPGVGGARS
jgi:uroporphyrin-3 C-methyltransferase